MAMAKKIVQLLGQRYNPIAESAMNKEVILTVSIVIYVYSVSIVIYIYTETIASSQKFLYDICT